MKLFSNLKDMWKDTDLLGHAVIILTSPIWIPLTLMLLLVMLVGAGFVFAFFLVFDD